ncbi:hypothetical protein GCM10027275_15250 [Rhabdobacter roseus]|uniref:Glycosyltransferase involved in cell wall biosynthesis n=1 Tax=Rhabdobacter roseus TaxID=1655419 RepID=A0A840TKI2_9BACT|nr:glycosyltransferase family 2 protein [Rhabdobacter roseus]MBB5283445.1 glycosyltransferase involved in cell wall biosynthesis [Rhabdobacter roseus]
MNVSPLISVALCTYNGAKFLNEQLDSLVGQTYPNLEIVAVDDGSSDGTLAILNQYAARYPFLRVHQNETNLGFNLNFEKALRLCTGDYLAISDQDDVWDPEKLRLQFEALGTHQLIYHDSAFVDESGASISYRVSDKMAFYRGDRPEVFLYLNCVSGHSVLLRKSVLDHALPLPAAFPKGYYYDQWITYIATGLGTITYLPQCLVKYRLHHQNTTDMLAQKQQKRPLEQKINALKEESEWLRLCAGKAPASAAPLVEKLYRQSLKRNASWGYFPYGLTIWKHRRTLLFLLKKKAISKFFFTLRKVWGIPAKRLL